jgi:microcystin-dependent protein
MSNPYVGEIRVFGGNFAPSGWAFCDGALLPISDYETLFTLIGTTYGGDGQQTFALPNLVSRIPFGDGGTQVIGQAGGLESVTLSSAQMPVHSHLAQASDGAGTSTSAANFVWASSEDTPYTTAAPNVTMDPTAVGSTGGSQPHENRPPFLAMTFIISLFGIFPSQA